MDLSIIIVNYNVYQHLLNCIKSLNASLSGMTFEIIVVDNNSSERQIDFIINEFPDVKLVKLNRNVGFGAANNAAMKIASGDFFFLVNPDIIVYKDCIQKLVNFLGENKNVGAVAPALFTPENKIDYYYSSFPSVYSIIMQQFGLYNTAPGMRKKMFDYFDENIGKGTPFKVEQVMGASILTRKSVYKEIGGFDEIFFLYQEETDWELRMTKKGWEIFIVPEAKALHDHHSSANKLGKIYVGYHGLRSITLYYIKNFGFIRRTLLRLTMITALPLRLVKYTILYSLYPSLLIKSFFYSIRIFLITLTPRKFLLKKIYNFP